MKKINILCTAIFFLCVFSRCQKEEFDNGESSMNVNIEPQGQFTFHEGQMILGKKLENPYSVENMKAAYEKLQADNTLKSKLKIEPTHYYVRFRPKNGKELYLISSDTMLYIYDYPLDVEIKRGGTHYHDPEIQKGEITWQYTVVPTDYDFPKVQCQKLAELYLPENGKELTELKSVGIKHFDWVKLETEALRMTGNLNESEQNESSLKSTSWRPAGTIKVFDDIIDSYSKTTKVFSHYEYFYCDTGEPVGADDPTIEVPAAGEGGTGEIPEGENICAKPIYHYVTNNVNSHYIPIEGAEVRARRWFTTHKGITDANGSFTCDGTFNRDANYSIKWERHDFDIRDGSYGQAYFNGPDMTGDWNLIIRDTEDSPKSFLFAHILRAAYTYYYKHHQWGIKTPTAKGFLQQRLHIAGKDKNGTSHYFDFNHLWQAAEVVVYRNNYDSRDIFGTTIHELAHVSHWDSQGFSDINWLIDKRMTESWAEGVEAVVTNDVYATNDYGTNQSRTIAAMTDGGDFDGYTSIVWDLIDDVNLRTDIYGGNTAYVNDKVSGYTLSQIEDALPSLLGSWWVWRSNLVDDNENPTEEHVSELFQQLN